MNIILPELAQFLHNENVGIFSSVNTNGNIFIEHKPDKPDTAICLFSTAGLPDNSLFPEDNLGVQIIVRGNADASISYNLAGVIYDKLNGFRNSKLIPFGSDIISILGIQTPVNIGRDKKNRQEYSINFLIQVANTGTDRTY